MDRVDAQQARRVLDRIVGYKLSPLLWRKVKKGLSAGRVQSVALRLICEREKEILDFIPEEYWTVDCYLKKGRKKFPIKLSTYKNKKIELKNEDETNNDMDDIGSGPVGRSLPSDNGRLPVDRERILRPGHDVYSQDVRSGIGCCPD